MGTSVYASNIYPRQAISSYYPMLSASDTLTWQRQPRVHLRRRLLLRTGSLLERSGRLSDHDFGMAANDPIWSLLDG